MNRKLETMDLKGNQYAKVSTRLKQFREDYPNSKVETINNKLEDGTIEFTSYIWKNKDEYIDVLKEVKDAVVARGTADSTGHSSGKAVAEKKFEKLETIALGRALANLGYMASGEIASFEEMEEFIEYKREQKENAIDDALDQISKAKSISKLKNVFMGLGPLIAEKEIVDAKDKRKAELSVAVVNKKEVKNEDSKPTTKHPRVA